MQDYIENLVLDRVISLLSTLPNDITFDKQPTLFSTLQYFPLNAVFNKCINSDLFSIADSCTTKSLPKTFQSSSFARRYANLLGNTSIAPSASYQGDFSVLKEAASTLNQCTFAARMASKGNGGICYYPKNNASTPCQYVPCYKVNWIPLTDDTSTNIHIKVNAYRTDKNAKWQSANNRSGQPNTPQIKEEKIVGSLSYSQIRIAEVSPLPFDQIHQQGWYDDKTIQAISSGETEQLKYTPISEQVFKANHLSRARLFVIVGQVNITLSQTTKNNLPQPQLKPVPMSRKQKAKRVDFHLTRHLKVPRAQIKSIPNKERNVNNAQTVTQWDSGDLYKALNAGYILAVIEDVLVE